MAYQVQKKKRLTEELELLDDTGRVAHTIHVELDADDMVAKINRKYTALTKALADTEEIRRKNGDNEHMQEALEMLGSAVVSLFEAVFGEEDTGIIVDFYENRYIEMSREIIPFITSVVMPRLTEIRKENKKSCLGQYNRTKKRALWGKR